MTTIADAMKLSRSDIRHFDGDTIKLVLEMQEKGWRGIRNKNGHVTLYAPDGESHIMATSNPRSHFYISQRLRRYEAGLPMEEEEPKEKTTQKWPCPRPNCQKFFVSDEKLSIHMAVDHDKKLICPEDGCSALFDKPNVLGRHRHLKHGYQSPNYKKRKEQEANRKKKEEAEKIEEIVKTVDIQTVNTDAIIVKSPISDEEIENAIEKAVPEQPIVEEYVDINDLPRNKVELTDFILNMRVGDLQEVLKATGMDMEIVFVKRSE